MGLKMQALKWNIVDSSGSEEFPWTVDGAGIPPNASELLPELVKLIEKVTEQVRILAKDEDEQLTERSLYEIIPPYDQAKALGKTNMDVDRIAARLPCGKLHFRLPMLLLNPPKIAFRLLCFGFVRYVTLNFSQMYNYVKYTLIILL